MLAVWSNGQLIKVKNHINTRHRLKIMDVREKWPKKVNSYHAFVVNACPKGFEVKAKSPEGHIEAIKHKKLPWEGWMWHPERGNALLLIQISTV